MFTKVALTAVLASAAFAAVQEGDVIFYLTNSAVQLQQFGPSTIDTLGLDNTTQMKILIHGWIDNINSYWYPGATNNYLTRGGSNIIAIDWSKYAMALYLSSVYNLPAVSNFIGSVILQLADTYSIPLASFHLLGHSLGAHGSGFVGQYIFATTGQRVGRITGLDPAGPAFSGTTPDKRLSPDDADFVDVIHSDGGGLGISSSIGDIDFYPNGGTAIQNGCSILDLGCSHKRAPLYFAESITSDEFIAVCCDNVSNLNAGSCNNIQITVMGEDVDQTARGNFCLNTASSAPFALG